MHPHRATGWKELGVCSATCSGLHEGSQRPGAVAPSLSLLKHKDGLQGSLDLAPLALPHRESHRCCSKCQAAKGLSCIFSYFGRNQTAGWRNSLKNHGSSVEDPRPYDSKQNHRTTMLQRLFGSVFLVTVPGCRNCPIMEQSHYFPSITSSW